MGRAWASAWAEHGTVAINKSINQSNLLSPLHKQPALHAHDRFQNVTEHRVSGHIIWNNVQTCGTQKLSAYCHYSAISRYTTGTLPSLTVTVHMHPTPNCELWTVRKAFDVKISSSHECLHYGKMAAVSVRHMHTGRSAHLIALITLSICEPWLLWSFIAVL